MRYFVDRRKTAATLLKSSGAGLSIYLGQFSDVGIEWPRERTGRHKVRKEGGRGQMRYRKV